MSIKSGQSTGTSGDVFPGDVLLRRRSGGLLPLIMRGVVE